MPKKQVLILSFYYTDQLVQQTIESGARAYVLKSDASTNLLAAVEALTRNRPFFTSGATRTLIEVFAMLSPHKQRP